MSSINAPRVIPRSEHTVSPAAISDSALKVLARLADAGFDALLVGGCVRDLMLGREPKDFDVVTDARPEQVRQLFRNSRLIGRRFRLVHVRYGREIIEVATYRAAMDSEVKDDGADRALSAAGQIMRDNVYGTREEDARRRDFTVNGLYFDNRELCVIDYVGGVEDLKQGVLKVIGDPQARFREDPVRMLRAIRFGAKLGFRIDPDTAGPIHELASMIQAVPPARLFEEVLKLFHGGCAVATYELLRQYHLFEQLFPLSEQSLAVEDEGFPLTLLPRALDNTDRRINEDKPVTPAFLFAAVLWEPVRLRLRDRLADGESPQTALDLAAREVMVQQQRRITIPRRFSTPMMEIWSLQARFNNRGGRRPYRLMEHPRFRAGYDFLLLRAEVGEVEQELAEWWTRFQEAGTEQRNTMVRATPGGSGRRRRRPRRRQSSGGS